MPIHLAQREGALLLNVKVVPNSSRNRITGQYNGGLKVTVSKPPQDGAANKAVIHLLADALSIPPNNIQIIRGQTNARKQFLMRGITVELIRQRLLNTA